MATSLLQDVLRPQVFGVDRLNSKLAAASLRDSPPARHSALADGDSEEDELVGVVRAFRSFPSLLGCLCGSVC